MLLFARAAAAFESEPVDVRLLDEAELFTNVEFSTGPVPAGSPLAVELRTEANGGAGVEMKGEAALGWPGALGLGFTGEPGSGLYLLDASLDAVAEVQVDLSDFGYTGTFEVGRLSLGIEGATFFDPFVLDGADTDRVEVVDTATGTQLIDYSYDIFLGVTLNFTADATPVFTAGFEGVQWAVNEGVIASEGASATLAPERVAEFPVDAVFTAAWDARFDLVFSPTFSACFPIYGCVEVARFELPVELAYDAFTQDFPADTYTFPLPLVSAGVEGGDFGEVELGTIRTLEVPIANAGALAAYGRASLEGTGQFSVFPDQFNALPGGDDGVVVTFAPTVEGPQTATLVLASNDPTLPTITLPLTGNGAAEPPPEDVVGTEEVASVEVGGCGCASGGGAPPAVAALAALALLARRRRA